MERQLASARKQLEEETLLKVDLENRVQSLKVTKVMFSAHYVAIDDVAFLNLKLVFFEVARQKLSFIL